MARVRVITGTLLTPGNWEHRGHITHELLHTLGHHHTQNRADRCGGGGTTLPGTSTSPWTRPTSPTWASTRSASTVGCSGRSTTACRSCTTGGRGPGELARWNSLAVDPSSPTMEPKEEQCDLRSRNRCSPPLLLHPRYITWADMDLVNSNYECPVEYSGEQGVIQSHPTWPAQDYPDSYRCPLQVPPPPYPQEALVPRRGGRPQDPRHLDPLQAGGRSGWRLLCIRLRGGA